MSVQAAAYDGGTFVFAFARELYDAYDVTAGTFLYFFLLVPLFTFTTGYLFWPMGSLEEDIGKTQRTRPAGYIFSHVLQTHRAHRR